jgi:hypothetical protein
MSDAIPPPPDDLDHLSADDLLRAAVREMRLVRSELAGVHARLDSGRYRMLRLEQNMALCLRGVQVTLLERATKLQVVRSLHEVTEVLLRLEAEALADIDDDPPPTIPNNAIPVR